MKHFSLPVLISTGGLLAAALLSGCETSPNMSRGAGIGAVAGAVIGGVIGHQSGEAGAGAAIGAALGGVAGGAVGSQKDNEELRRSQLESDGSYYRALLTENEVATLRARAEQAGRPNVPLTDFLTSAEKENLRRRAAAQKAEIGR